MPLNDRHCYRALVARDRRFDGRFFVGVTSTGIYCRPICPARTPREPHCRFFASAAAAERRGFRPCLRCRPELAPHQQPPASAHDPGSTASVAPVDMARTRAYTAGARIASGALNAGSVSTLAAALGTSERQLRRVVTDEFGASPVALAQTRRLLTAKQLLTESTLPMAQVALASGFGSVRRFNALFLARYRLTPSELQRRSHRGTTHADTAPIRLTLAVRAPYDWAGVCAFLAARAMPGVEYVSELGGATAPFYVRTVRLHEHHGTIKVSARGQASPAWPSRGEPANTPMTTPATAPLAESLVVELSEGLLPVLVPLLAQLREFLDLDAAPGVIATQLGADPLLAAEVARSPGRRVPGAMDGFELAVRAVLGQQVSVRGATTLAGRLVQALAEPLEPSAPSRADTTNTGVPLSTTAHSGLPLTHLPLTATRLASASVAQIAAIGLPTSRARALQALAQAVASGTLPWLSAASAEAVADHSESGDCIDALLSLPGIGPWTAQYIAMRALHLPDAFPDGDLALRKAAGGLTAPQLRDRAEAWRPWRAYAAMHLWCSLSL